MKLTQVFTLAKLALQPWRARATPRASSLGMFIALFCAIEVPAVVITEIHYQPPAPEAKRLEFVELYNPSALAVDLAGWRLERGVRFEFPAGAVIPAGGYVVVARNRAALAAESELETDSLFGDFKGSLANEGEEILVVDHLGVYVDSVMYDNSRPWPSAAAGDGSSLHRICGEEDGFLHTNWTGLSPTPGAGHAFARCPAPALPIPPLAINEIFYHPVQGSELIVVGDDGEASEFIELVNTSGAALDVGGWRFSNGIRYEFPAGTIIPADGVVVLARDATAASVELVDPGVFLDQYEGRLSNRGERVTLLDAAETVVDSVKYLDHGKWAYGPDGFGRSLVRMSVDRPTDDPANWVGSTVKTGGFQVLQGTGGRSPGLAPQQLVIAIDGEGEAIVDGVVLEDVANPGVNLIDNGDFVGGMQGWTAEGAAALSEWSPTGGVDGGGALRLVSTGPCGDEQCRSAQGVWAAPNALLSSTATYRLRLSVKHISGSVAVQSGLVLGVRATTLHSAGEASAVDSAAPFIDHVARFPRQPSSVDKTWLVARVRGVDPGAPTVRMEYRVGVDGVLQELLLVDDGNHLDRDPGDGIFGVELPAFAGDTQLRYRFELTSTSGTREYPEPLTPGAALGEEHLGYYVSDAENPTDLPTFHILLPGVDGTDFRAVNAHLLCDFLQPASFAFEGDLYPDVGVRWRGNTACGIDKRNFKIRFSKAQPFRGLRKMNFNGLWTDKSLMRERVAWQFTRELGMPYVETEYGRVLINSDYYGLFLCLEHPDTRFMRRLGLDTNGSLYKAKQPPFNPDPAVVIPGVVEREVGAYPDGWEEEVNEGRDFSDIEEFVGSMHAAGVGPMSLDFWQTRSFPELMIGFQVAQVVLGNFDSATKNHFLYHDVDEGRWAILSWDLDLVLGKFFDLNAINPNEGRQQGTLNDVMMSQNSEVQGLLTPWYMSTVNRNPRRNWAIDFFFRAGDGFYQRAYLVRLLQILEEKFRLPEFSDRLDELFEFLFVAQAEDFDLWGRYPSNVQGFPEDMAGNLLIIERELDARRDFLLNYIATNHAEILSTPRVKISEILFLSPRDAELEFVELTNVSAASVNLRGWTIDGIGYQFPTDEDVVLPAGGVVVVARDPQALEAAARDGDMPALFGPYSGRLNDAGEELRLLDAGPGFPATVDYVAYSCGGDWPEIEPGFSVQMVDVAAGRDNDLPTAWVQSASRAGNPGRTQPEFRRGDANSDEQIDISDAIFVLLHLFVVPQDLRCFDAADSNDSGNVDLSDPIALLNHLFRGEASPPPPAPYPGRGVDPTADDLTCGD